MFSNAAFAPYTKPKLSYQGIGSSAALTAAALVSDGVSTQKPQVMSDVDCTRLQPPPITKPDDKFLEDGMEFVWDNQVDLAELNDLFQRVGFPQRDPVKLQMALQNTYATVWVRAARKSRVAKLGQLLGFARATSDGALSATIWDVAVHPAWQRNGLGRAMVERLTASLVQDGIGTITLYAEPNVVGMYEKLGFVKDVDGIRGLAYQTKKAKSLARSR